MAKYDLNDLFGAPPATDEPETAGEVEQAETPEAATPDPTPEPAAKPDPEPDPEPAAKPDPEPAAEPEKTPEELAAEDKARRIAEAKALLAEEDPAPEPAAKPAEKPVEQEVVLPPKETPPAKEYNPIDEPTASETKAVAVSQPAAPPARAQDAPEKIEVPGGLKSASWGTKVSRYPIEKYKGTLGPKDRISIPLLEWEGESLLLISKVHYSEETGRFYCFGGECCEHMGLPDVRYNFPVLLYETDKKGQINGAEFEIQYLQCAQTRYEEFLVYIENGQDLTDMDFIVTCEDEQYQKLKLAGFTGAQWRKNKDFARMVIELLLKKWAHAPQVIASKMTPERLMDKLEIGGGSSGSSEEAPESEPFDLTSFLKG